jgi:hypothetical protein
MVACEQLLFSLLFAVGIDKSAAEPLKEENKMVSMI